MFFKEIFVAAFILFYTPLCGAAAFDIPLTRNARRDFFDFSGPFYFADISLGTPPQNLRLMVDTSTSTTMVWGKSCDGCSSVANRYDSSASSAASNKSTALSNFPYGDGSIEGFLFEDTMQVGSLGGVPQAEFLQVTQLTDGLPDAVSGIFGLAFDKTPETSATPFWQALSSANASANPEVGFWLSRDSAPGGSTSDSDSGNAGVFTLGGVNASLYSGNIEFLGLAAGGNQLGLWMLGITAITVGGKSIDITPNATLAMFDTSSNEIVGPDEDVRAIYAAIPGSSEPTETIFQYPCNTTVKISISFGGQSWDIDPQDMNQGVVQSGSSQCFGALGSRTGVQNPSWRLGIPFLRNVYTVLRQNPPAIGFAQLSTVAGGTGVPNATQSNTASVSASGQSSGTGASSGPTPTSSSPPQGASESKSNVGAIAGGVIAGVAVIILAVIGFILYRRRQRRHTTADRDSRDYTVSAFPSDMESSAPPLSSFPPMSVSGGGSPTSPALSPKRAAAAAAQRSPYGRLASDNYVMTQKGLRLTPGTSPAPSSATSASLSASSPSETSPSLSVPPALPPGAAPPATTDPAILQELQTLRNEVRWLVNERNDPPPTYT